MAVKVPEKQRERILITTGDKAQRSRAREVAKSAVKIKKEMDEELADRLMAESISKSKWFNEKEKAGFKAYLEERHAKRVKAALAKNKEKHWISDKR